MNVYSDPKVNTTVVKAGLTDHEAKRAKYFGPDVYTIHSKSPTRRDKGNQEVREDDGSHRNGSYRKS